MIRVLLTAGSSCRAGWHQRTRRVLCPGVLSPQLMKADYVSTALLGTQQEHRGVEEWAQQGLGTHAHKSGGCGAKDGTRHWSQTVCR